MMTIAVLAISVSALIITVIQNRRLASQLAALADAQTVTDEKLNRLSKTTKKTTCKQRAFDRRLQQQRKRQERMEKAQEKIRKEQTKQRETISKLSFRLSQAEADIQHQQTRLSQLYALLDIAQAEQAAALKGSRQDASAQKQIIALENQIANCEKRIRKAEFDRAQAQEGLAA